MNESSDKLSEGSLRGATPGTDTVVFGTLNTQIQPLCDSLWMSGPLLELCSLLLMGTAVWKVLGDDYIQAAFLSPGLQHDAEESAVQGRYLHAKLFSRFGSQSTSFIMLYWRVNFHVDEWWPKARSNYSDVWQPRNRESFSHAEAFGRAHDPVTDDFSSNSALSFKSRTCSLPRHATGFISWW